MERNYKNRRMNWLKYVKISVLVILLEQCFIIFPTYGQNEFPSYEDFDESLRQAVFVWRQEREEIFTKLLQTKVQINVTDEGTFDPFIGWTIEQVLQYEDTITKRVTSSQATLRLVTGFFTHSLDTILITQILREKVDTDLIEIEITPAIVEEVWVGIGGCDDPPCDYKVWCPCFWDRN